MSENKSKFNIEELVKKIESGDMSLLVVAGFVMIVPVIAILILTNGPKGGKRISQEKMKSMVHRKNVFNFGTADKNGKSSIPSGGMRSGSSSGSSGWFSERSPEQVVNDEIEQAMKAVERSMANVEAPMNLTGDEKAMYEAEHNFYLCEANGAIESRDFAKAEQCIKQALEQGKDNDYLTAYAYASLCALYEASGDKKKLEEAYKMYIEAVSKLPEELGGGNMKAIVRDAYQSMQALAKQADQGKIAEALSNNPIAMNSNSGNVDFKQVYQNFPIKYK